MGKVDERGQVTGAIRGNDNDDTVRATEPTTITATTIQRNDKMNVVSIRL